jgi:hypothetical protein
MRFLSGLGTWLRLTPIGLRTMLSQQPLPHFDVVVVLERDSGCARTNCRVSHELILTLLYLFQHRSGVTSTHSEIVSIQ